MLATAAQEQTTDVIAAQRARITQLVRAAYVSGGDLTELSAVLEADSPEDFAQRVMSYRAVSAAQQAELVGLQSLNAAITRDASGLTTLRGNLALAQTAAESQLAAVARAARAAQDAQAHLQALVLDRQSAMAAAKAALAADAAQGVVQHGVNSRLQTMLAAEARRLLGAAGARPGSSYPPVPGTLIAPVVGPITSPFGMRRHPITGVYKLHTGTDFGVPCGTVVHAARAGTVIQAYVDNAYGLRTVISHGVVDGALLTTTYNHQSRIDVQVGQAVRAGDPIGLSGTTGYSTGCHLHFELLVNADYVDPVPWI
jgi:murein DD-endopeptidase MepM/ murein hydrolase activator NlpD